MEMEHSKPQVRKDPTTTELSVPQETTGNSVSLAGHRRRPSSVMAPEDRSAAMAAGLDLLRPGHADAEVARNTTPERAVQSAAAPTSAPLVIPPVAVTVPLNSSDIVSAVTVLDHLIDEIPKEVVDQVLGPYLEEDSTLRLVQTIDHLQSRITKPRSADDQIKAFETVAAAMCDRSLPSVVRNTYMDMMDVITDPSAPTFPGKERIASKHALEKIMYSGGADMMRTTDDRLGLVDRFFLSSTVEEREQIANDLSEIMNPQSWTVANNEFGRVRDGLVLSDRDRYFVEAQVLVLLTEGEHMSELAKKRYSHEAVKEAKKMTQNLPGSLLGNGAGPSG